MASQSTMHQTGAEPAPGSLVTGQRTYVTNNGANFTMHRVLCGQQSMVRDKQWAPTKHPANIWVTDLLSRPTKRSPLTKGNVQQSWAANFPSSKTITREEHKQSQPCSTRQHFSCSFLTCHGDGLVAPQADGGVDPSLGTAYILD